MPVENRLRRLEQDVQKLFDRTDDLSAIRAEIVDIQRQVDRLGEEVKSLRRAVVTAAISFAGGTLILAMSILLGAH